MAASHKPVGYAFRPANDADLPALVALDQIAQSDAGRRAYIRKAVGAGACHVAVEGGAVAGYLVFDHSFYELGFVHTLYVAENQRRQGVGAALMRYAESLCQTPRLFTSTNLSNHPMQALLARLGYKLSGVVHDLDEGDPELIYVKYLQAGPA